MRRVVVQFHNRRVRPEEADGALELVRVPGTKIAVLGRSDDGSADAIELTFSGEHGHEHAERFVRVAATFGWKISDDEPS